MHKSNESYNLRDDIHRWIQPPPDWAPPYETDRRLDKKPVSAGVAATIAIIIAFSVMGYIMITTGGVPL